VKFHFLSQQGIENLSDEEAAKTVGKDRESSQRDFFDAIESKDFPKWKMFVQIMTEKQARTYRFHPFDLTKVWSKKDFHLIPVGEFELNKNPENYFPDVEQAASFRIRW
jgi:catalase